MATNLAFAKKVKGLMEGSKKLSKDAINALAVDAEKLKDDPQALMKFFDLIERANIASSLNVEEEAQSRARTTNPQRLVQALRGNLGLMARLKEGMNGRSTHYTFVFFYLSYVYMLDYTILFLTLSFLFFRIQRQRLTFHPT
jgi:hypothetical protein